MQVVLSPPHVKPAGPLGGCYISWTPPHWFLHSPVTYEGEGRAGSENQDCRKLGLSLRKEGQSWV